MKKIQNLKRSIVVGSIILGLIPTTMFGAPQKEQQFIRKMVSHYHFKKTYLTELLETIKPIPEVIHLIKRPYEDKPWHRYKIIFLKKGRVRKGALYWIHHADTLATAEKYYGVPASIIVAIIGVETFYGRDKGIFPVLESLTTLSFFYPPRALFFQSELAQYLLLSREQNIDPEKTLGSYAGAMGLPQFMPSSYRRYAVDFNANKKKDLFHDTEDVIGSVANYLKQKGWQPAQPIATPAIISGTKYKKILNNRLKTLYSITTLRKYGIKPIKSFPPNTMANLIRLKTDDGYKYWLGFHNFYVITKYNINVKYAMAVYQLAKEIKDLYGHK